jgi:aspartate-semialdehyde dehydrogenase
VRLVFGAGDATSSARFVPPALAAGAIAIDLSSHFRLDADVPLVVAGVNSEELERGRERGLVAVPDPLAVQLARILHPLREAAGVEQVNLVGLVAACAGGRSAVEELGQQTADLLNFREVAPAALPRQLAFNAIPQVGALDADGHSATELELVRECHKILADERMLFTVTLVYVPVFYGHSLALQVQTGRRMEIATVRESLERAGLSLAAPADYPTAVTESRGEPGVFVGRIREDRSRARSLQLWSVADALRLCAANALAIARELGGMTL